MCTNLELFYQYLAACQKSDRTCDIAQHMEIKKKTIVALINVCSMIFTRTGTLCHNIRILKSPALVEIVDVSFPSDIGKF